jgi:hypothetical protein
MCSVVLGSARGTMQRMRDLYWRDLATYRTAVALAEVVEENASLVRVHCCEKLPVSRADYVSRVSAKFLPRYRRRDDA